MATGVEGNRDGYGSDLKRKERLLGEEMCSGDWGSWRQEKGVVELTKTQYEQKHHNENYHLYVNFKNEV